MVDQATKDKLWEEIDGAILGLTAAREQLKDRACRCVADRRQKKAAPTSTREMSGCCATALERLYDRQIELAAAEAILADHINQGSPQHVIDYLADVVLCFQCAVDELASIRDDEC